MTQHIVGNTQYRLLKRLGCRHILRHSIMHSFYDDDHHQLHCHVPFFFLFNPVRFFPPSAHILSVGKAYNTAKAQFRQ